MIAKFIVTILSITSICTFELQTPDIRDVVSCTIAVQNLSQSIIDFALAVEKDHFDPGAASLTRIVDKVQDIIKICANSDTKINQYDQCIERLYPIIPSLGDLIDAIEHGYNQNIIEDSIKMAMTLTQGISVCIDV